jgi:hypothetical protein
MSVTAVEDADGDPVALISSSSSSSSSTSAPVSRSSTEILARFAPETAKQNDNYRSDGRLKALGLRAAASPRTGT